MLRLDDATTLIRRNWPALPTARVSFEAACGTVLRSAIRADRDVPACDRATMDGIAIAFPAWSSGVRAFEIEGTAAAGRPPESLRNPQSGCLQIMTGAPIPAGATCVIPVEDLDVTPKCARLRDNIRVVEGQHIHTRGADRRRNDLVLATGTRLSAADIAVAAGLGVTKIDVAAWPRAGILSVGDELVPAGRPVEDYQVRPSNACGIEAALRRFGLQDVRVAACGDTEESIDKALADLMRTSDLILTSGGVSKGAFDYVPAALERAGFGCILHGIRQKPGKPLWFGVSDRRAAFGLPGNPVSTLVCLHRLVLPGLLAAAGAPPSPPLSVSLAAPLKIESNLTTFLPARLETDDNGRTLAALPAYHGSGDFTALSATHGFIEVDGPATLAAGTRVRYHRWQT